MTAPLTDAELKEALRMADAAPLTTEIIEETRKYIEEATGKDKEWPDFEVKFSCDSIEELSDARLLATANFVDTARRVLPIALDEIAASRTLVPRLIKELQEARERIEAAEKLRRAVYGFKEYFDAIDSGEYPKSRNELRSFERVLLHRANEALAAYDGERK